MTNRDDSNPHLPSWLQVQSSNAPGVSNPSQAGEGTNSNEFSRQDSPAYGDTESPPSREVGQPDQSGLGSATGGAWRQREQPQRDQRRSDGGRHAQPEPHEPPRSVKNPNVWWRPEQDAPLDTSQTGSSVWGSQQRPEGKRPDAPSQHDAASQRDAQPERRAEQPQQPLLQDPQQPSQPSGGPWVGAPRPAQPQAGQPKQAEMGQHMGSSLAPGHPGPSSGSTEPREQVDLQPPTALGQDNLVNPVKAAPKKGWRKMVHSVSAGKVNPGGSRAELEEDRLLAAVRAPLRGDYRIAVMSLKGGVGKTTTTVALGGVFAKERGDRVIAIDANPDLGTLAQRAAAPGPATIRDLLNAGDTSRYPQVRAFTNQATSRLEVIGSERDPAVSEAFSELDYRRAIDILQHHYNVILTDCGTGLMHSAMSGVLDLANSLVLVTSPALDGAQSASATLDWLTMHGYDQLAANSVVVVSSSAPGKPTVDLDQLIEHFRARTRAVHVIPYDRHLAEGAVVDIDLLARPTLTAYRQLAATVAEDFGSWHRHAK